MQQLSRLHPLPFDNVRPPERFTYPFHYRPHALCLRAWEALCADLRGYPEWQEELNRGKMLGVLVVEGGFLAAFSGTLGGRGSQPYFVPPVFDTYAADGYFKREEGEISKINARIATLQQSPGLCDVRKRLHSLRQKWEAHLTREQELLRRRKKQRDVLRANGMGDREALIRESQYDKASFRRLKQTAKQEIGRLEDELNHLESPLRELQGERARRSQALQQWLFDNYVFLNAQGEERSLRDLFAPNIPPAAAGECCAPKLLQYAYANGLRPLCMAEFWIGASPVGVVRHEGHYYPACQERCKPILDWMLRGLLVDPNPLLEDYGHVVSRLRIIYSDDALAVVDKPSGMLSVPGKENLPSVQSELLRLLPHADHVYVVHRLDMSTSGLMVFALTLEAQRTLQRAFEARNVVKRYRARLSRPVKAGLEGDISLPLCPDPTNRPRQMVHHEFGRSALTHYRTLENNDILLWPHTGRTHQLRVHLAHPEGLDNPILGDELYGLGGVRLHLHAECLEFDHPVSGCRMKFHCVSDFACPEDKETSI